uniref:Uncharacterized protein n=1 Tax=uncultured marine thaumarchaeote KM3_72_D04 TaxID=1456262 RepID=A0A075HJC2_9ARCH|nr:hypothetical protein [uncultured marine thaumarchaeote KM3_72_D04]
MKILKDITKTILGQNEESNDQFLEELRHEQPKTKTDQQECREESIIEQEIIKCQRLHGRLLNSTSRKLRIRFGKYSYISGKYYCEIIDRVINRFAKQRQRGNCPVKAQIEEEEKPEKDIIDHYFEKKKESEFGNTL